LTGAAALLSLKLGTHPEMERFAILKRSMPSVAGEPMASLLYEQNHHHQLDDTQTQFTVHGGSIPDGERFSQGQMYR
jgi:hypothetical protein